MSYSHFFNQHPPRDVSLAGLAVRDRYCLKLLTNTKGAKLEFIIRLIHDMVAKFPSLE